MLERALSSCLAALAIGGVASAQLVISGLDGGPPIGGTITAWYIDVATGDSAPLWRAAPNAFAVRDSDGTVFFPSDSIRRWSYSAASDPVVHGPLYVAQTMQQVPMAGAVFAIGKLWGVPDYPSSTPGLYEIVLAPAGQTSYAYLRKQFGYSFRGLAFDPASGLFFACSLLGAPFGGIYAIDLTPNSGAPVKVASLPAGVTEVGGLTCNAGKLYLTPPGAGAIHVFDLASGQYVPNTLQSPSTSTGGGAYGGAGWAPSLVPVPLPPAKFCWRFPTTMGCFSSLVWSGTSSASASSGFVVSEIDTAPSMPGLLLYQLGGPRSDATFGSWGMVCFGPSGIRRSPGLSSSAGAPCTGTYSFDMNAFAAGALGGTPQPGLHVPGTLVYCRFWGRDHPAYGGVQLSEALEYGVRP